MRVRDFFEILFVVLLCIILEAAYKDYRWVKAKIAQLREL